VLDAGDGDVGACVDGDPLSAGAGVFEACVGRA
jgi:hypothetical protein